MGWTVVAWLGAGFGLVRAFWCVQFPPWWRWWATREEGGSRPWWGFGSGGAWWAVVVVCSLAWCVQSSPW